MRAPEFWRHDGLPARLLAPLGWLWSWGVDRRLAETEAWRAAVPVICVGNIVAGGAGKTPVAIALAERLKARGRAVAMLSRGHGGREVGPRRVDPLRHDAARVGDEPLLLARVAPTWVARWRPDGAVAATEAGAEVIVMDDGFQNPTLAKDLSLVVVDGGYGFGNGRVIPAGPCREPIDKGLARADAVVVVGDDTADVARFLAATPVLRARLVPGPEAAALAGKPVVAFAGIGRPEKFFASLAAVGARIVEARPFADHHPYSRAEIEELLAVAAEAKAIPVTTEKDLTRVPETLRNRISILTVRLEWEDTRALDRLLDRVVSG